MKTETLYIGIDPGITGAISWIFDNECNSIPMPIQKKKVNFIKLVETLSGIIQEIDDNTPRIRVVIAVEKQWYHKSDGKPSVWTNSAGYAAILNALAIVHKQIHDLEVTIVKATVWKSKFNLIVTVKEASALGRLTKSRLTAYKKGKTAEKVLALYPKAEILGPRGGLRDGLSDAIMIATWMKVITEEKKNARK